MLKALSRLNLKLVEMLQQQAVRLKHHNPGRINLTPAADSRELRISTLPVSMNGQGSRRFIATQMRHLCVWLPEHVLRTQARGKHHVQAVKLCCRCCAVFLSC